MSFQKLDKTLQFIYNMCIFGYMLPLPRLNGEYN